MADFSTTVLCLLKIVLPDRKVFDHTRIGVALTVISCCGSCNPTNPSVAGDYWWYGSRIYFVDGKYGFKSEVQRMSTHATVARIVSSDRGTYLELPECAGIELERSGPRGQILTAEAQNCELSDIQRALGVQRRGLSALRIDLERGVMHQRYCEQGSLMSGCGHDDALFVSMDDADQALWGGGGQGAFLSRAGLAGEGGADAQTARSAALPLSGEQTGTEALWAYTSGTGTLWLCDFLDEESPGCVSGDGLRDFQSDGAAGTVHRLADGRFYLDGFDCFAPESYEGEPLLCMQSLKGFTQIPSPEARVTRLVVRDDHLSFEAKMVGVDYEYFVRIEAPLVRIW